MEGEIVHEHEVSAPANVVWDIYGGLKLGQLVCDLLPYISEKIEVVEGDGGVGTVLKITFPPGTPIFSQYKEKFTKIDNENRVKEVDTVEGGYLDHGFSLYRTRFEIFEKDEGSSIVKSSIVYKADTEDNASLVSSQALVLVSEAIGKYLSLAQS